MAADLHLSISDGPSNNTALRQWVGSIDDLAELVGKAPVGQKDGSYLVRGPFTLPVRCDANISRADVVIIDGDKRIDPDTGELFDGAPAPHLVHEVLRDRGIQHLLFTTWSHDPERQRNRWRAIVPAPIHSHAELLAVVDHVVEKINQAGVLVANSRENGNWSQAWYLPRRRDLDAPFAFFDGSDGDPIDRATVERIAEAWQAARSATRPDVRRAEGRAAPYDLSTPVGRFNAAYGNPSGIVDMLERRGYRFVEHDLVNGQTGYRLLRPGSQSGIAGVHVYPGARDGRWLVFCHHAGDVLDQRDENGRQLALDAFEVFTVLDHRGNKKDATRAAAELLGMQRTGRGPSVHMADVAEDDADDDGNDGHAVIDQIAVDDILSDGPPLLRRYADYATAGSAFKVKPWAFAGALAFVGLGTARFWYGPTGLSTSILQVILGPTESGKDKVVVDPLATLLAAADKAFVPRNGEALAAPMFTSRMINRISSGKALEARLESFPATTFVANEMGAMFARMGGPKADGLMVQLKELLLASFGKDSSTISEKVFAHAPEKASTAIIRPCLSVIGLMTDDQARHFDRETVKDGLLNRFIVIPSPRLAMHPVTRSPEVDPELINWLLQCHKAASAMGDTPTTVPWGRGAEAAFSAMALAAHEALEERPLNHRFAMKALKLALIFAVARDLRSPEIRVGDIERAKTWLDRTSDAAMRAILLAGGMANGEHHADLLKLAIELQDKGESGHIPISRVFHHRSSEARESAIRNAIQVGIADVVTSGGEVISESVMRERGLGRGLRLVPRMAGVRRFMSMSGRA